MTPQAAIAAFNGDRWSLADAACVSVAAVYQWSRRGHIPPRPLARIERALNRNARPALVGTAPSRGDP